MPYSILIDGDIQTFLCENSFLIKLLEYFESIRSTVKLKAMEIVPCQSGEVVHHLYAWW